MSTRVLVLGATGMLGHAVFKKMFYDERYQVYGTVRDITSLNKFFSEAEKNFLLSNIDVNNFNSILNVFRSSEPQIVINCIGIIKHLPEAHNRFMAINVNSLFPHQLSNICEVAKARLIHISTDCIFSGKKGDYTEQDISDAEDIYGRTKFLGEVDDLHTITLRTSIIGHELHSNIALVDWFLSQKEKVKGYTQAIYTGLTTYELANVIINYVIPNKDLHGLYHVASDKISKYDLLQLIAKIYDKKIDIDKFTDFIIDRSMHADKFRADSGYVTPTWTEMIKDMYQYYTKLDCYQDKIANVFLN